MTTLEAVKFAEYAQIMADGKPDVQEFYKIAESALRAQHEREDPNPLTLDELRQMKGEPVWVQSPGIPEYGRWAVVEGVDITGADKILYLHDDFTCHEYGRVWLAYRHNSKEAPA